MSKTKVQIAEDNDNAIQIIDALRCYGLLYRDEIELNCGLTKSQITRSLKILKNLNLVNVRTKCGALLIEYRRDNGKEESEVLFNSRQGQESGLS